MNHVRLLSSGLLLLTCLVPGGASAQSATHPSIADTSRTAFNAADVNKDSVLDVNEVVADSILAFGRVDTQRTGFISFSQLPRHSPERFRRADRDADGRLSLGEVVADRVHEFFLIDSNRDGVLSIEEVLSYAAAQRRTASK
jgi:Ca2+-binding EF-hand superfamily protein